MISQRASSSVSTNACRYSSSKLLPSGGQWVSGYVAVGRLPGLDLVEVRPRAPEARGERALGVLLAPVGAAVEHPDVHRDARLLGLIGEGGGQLGQAGGVVGGEQVDRQALLPGLREQLTGLLDVLLALREVGGVARIEHAVHVVGHAAVTRQHALHHLLAVDDETHRLTDARIGERFLVDRHRDRQPAAGLRFEHRQVGVRRHGGDLAERQVDDARRPARSSAR